MTAKETCPKMRGTEIVILAALWIGITALFGFAIYNNVKSHQNLNEIRKIQNETAEKLGANRRQIEEQIKKLRRHEH